MNVRPTPDLILDRRNTDNGETTLSKIGGEIADLFGLERLALTEKLRSTTAHSLDEFRMEVRLLAGNNKILDQASISRKDKLLYDFYTLNEQIKLEHLTLTQESQAERSQLAGNLHENMPIFADSFLSTILPQTLLKRAISPQCLSDEISGGCIGSIYSGKTIVTTTWKITLGMAQSPYHAFLLLSGNATYDPKSPV